MINLMSRNCYYSQMSDSSRSHTAGCFKDGWRRFQMSSGCLSPEVGASPSVAVATDMDSLVKTTVSS